MFTGRDALMSVEQAISRVRADEGQLDQSLRSAIEDAARLRREEAEGFRVLARVKLDVMVRDQVVQDLDATERRALAMIKNQRDALEQLGRRRDAAQRALDQAEATKHERDGDLAQVLEAVDAQRAATAARIENDAARRAAKEAVAAAQAIADNAEKKAAMAETDLAEKRKPYEADPLFMYLWNKKHGREEDRSGPFVKFFDRKVARLVRYSESARPNYAMLLEIPARLREHAKARAEEVAAAQDRVGAIERAALVRDGIEALEARAAAATEAVRAAEAAVVKANADLAAIEAEREKALGASEDAAYGGAIDILAQSLAREDMRQLYAEAMRTRTIADDQALDAITRARGQLEKADAEVAEIRKQIREASRKRTELEGARDRARAGGYDSPMGGFDGSQIIGQVIGGILSGVLQGAALDKAIRDNYRWREPQSDPDFGRTRRSDGGFSSPWGGGGSSSGSGGPWGGSWGGGGGGGSSSGGGGGGDYKTGGSF